MPKKDALTALSELKPGGPDMAALRQAYEHTLTDLNDFFAKCQKSFDDRRNHWPGKGDDLRKSGPDAFPWEGASDTEAHVISERVNTLVALCMTALARANIQAYPVEAGDISRARIVASFLKWMKSTYIPGFEDQMERAANYLFERSMIITYVGWEREDSRYLQTLRLDQIKQNAPAIALAIARGTNDKEITQELRRIYPALKEAAAKRALEDLRTKGAAQLPVVRRQIDRPCLNVCAPDEDAIFPSWCLDPQRAPYCFYRVRMTVQDVWGKVDTAGWDQKWVEEVVKRARGVDTFHTNRQRSNARRTEDIRDDEVVDVIFAYQRLFDRKERAMGIYCTIFNPLADGYAKFELLNGLTEYPFRITRLSEDNKRLYDIQTIPELLRGIQWNIKTEIDARIDLSSLRNSPTLLHPKGQPPPEVGPGRKLGRLRPTDFEYLQPPTSNPVGSEVEERQELKADKLVGLDEENPLSGSRRQFLVNKFLGHVRDVMKAAWKAYQRHGPDSIFFTVTGVPDPMKFDKGNPDEDYHVVVAFDVQNSDPDTMEKKLTSIASVIPMDRNGRIDIDRYIDFTLNAIDPMLADAILQPTEVSQQKMIKDVTDDLAKIYAGIEVGARPNGAQMALQICQQYASQPDIAQQLEANQAFAERLQKYVAQYQFAIQQTYNAEIGKVGTMPASMGSTPTQSANTQTPSY